MFFIIIIIIIIIIYYLLFIICYLLFIILVMQLQPVTPRQFSGLSFPLEEHKDSLLVSLDWQNTTNRVHIPASLFKHSGAPSKLHPL